MTPTIKNKEPTMYNHATTQKIMQKLKEHAQTNSANARNKPPNNANKTSDLASTFSNSLATAPQQPQSESLFSVIYLNLVDCW